MAPATGFWGKVKGWLNGLIVMTNATKAGIALAFNALLELLSAFNIVLTQTQINALGVFANAIFALFTAFTYQRSALRKHPREVAAHKAAKRPAKRPPLKGVGA